MFDLEFQPQSTNDLVRKPIKERCDNVAHTPFTSLLDHLFCIGLDPQTSIVSTAISILSFGASAQLSVVNNPT